MDLRPSLYANNISSQSVRRSLIQYWSYLRRTRYMHNDVMYLVGVTFGYLQQRFSPLWRQVSMPTTSKSVRRSLIQSWTYLRKTRYMHNNDIYTGWATFGYLKQRFSPLWRQVSMPTTSQPVRRSRNLILNLTCDFPLSIIIREGFFCNKIVKKKNKHILR